MSSVPILRRLAVGRRGFLWSVGHRHQVPGLDGIKRCTEVFRAYEVGHKHGPVELSFLEGPGRGTGDLQDGVVWTEGATRGETAFLDLGEPAVARVIIEYALEQGWQPDGAHPWKVDGWTWFSVLEQRARAGEDAS